MTSFQVIAILVSLTALFSYVNHRYIHLHATIGVMLIALLLSLGMIALGHLGFGIQAAAQAFLERIPFGDALLHWMLGFLLFAGAMTVDVNELAPHRVITAALATVGTFLSMLIVGGLALLSSRITGMGLRLIDAMLLGAVLAPTDPVAVLGVFKRVGAPRRHRKRGRC